MLDCIEDSFEENVRKTREEMCIRDRINTVTLETIGEVTECLKDLPLLEEEIVSVSVEMCIRDRKRSDRL